MVNREGFPRALRYGSSAERPGIPAFRRRLGRSVRELLRELESTLPATAFTGSLLETVRSAYARGTPFSEAFGRLLLRFTRGTGLVVMDPTVPRLKELALPVFRTALANRAEARRRIARATTVIEAAGFPAQAAPEGYSVFHLGEAGTRKWLEDAGFPDEGAPLLSAAVLLRPLVQDFLLPTAAYVGGPAEIAYHAQIGRLYDLHRIPRPLVVPRHLVTVVPRSRLRVLDRDGIPFDELSRGDESALNRIAADPAAAEAIARARTAIRTRLAEVEEALGNLDGSLRAASRQAAGRMAAILHRLERKSVRAAKRLDSERRQRFLRARNLLFPGGVPQERRLSPLVFWNLYGPDFARWLLAALRDPAASRRRRNLLVR